MRSEAVAQPQPVLKATPPPWIQRVQEFARQVAPDDFCGKVELHFFQGGVTGTTVTQSYKG